MSEIRKIGGGVCAPLGFFSDGISAGLKSRGAKDLAFIYSDSLCSVSYVLTTNKMLAAPLQHLKSMGNFKSNFILINSKNANAMTGKAGLKDIDEIFGDLCTKYPDISNPIMSSTGVIGERLPLLKIKSAIADLDLKNQNSTAAAKAIMTTDAFYKMGAVEVVLDDGSSFKIGAIAKGAGMIDPSMATMLCFITTDADAPEDLLQDSLVRAVDGSFNAISVDGDRSTNDTVLLLSSNRSGRFDQRLFDNALEMLMLELAQMMVSDGEGATKMVTYHIVGAANVTDASLAAKALTNSLLQKTALFGEDPNWGRVAAVIGASGAECSERTLSIYFDDIALYERGEILFDDRVESMAAAVMKRDRFTIRCDLGQGDAEFKAYGCDLGHEYIKINADYRT